MAIAPHLPFVPVEEYLNTSYPDADREYIDGMVVERNVGTPGHSALQAIVVAHLFALQKRLGIAVLPECRTKTRETRFRVPGVLVMQKPYRKTDRFVLDPPFLIVEILSPDDRMKDTLLRFSEYETLGVRHIVQMDPEDRSTFSFVNGGLLPGDLSGFDLPGGGSLPFDSRALLAQLDEE